jgi:hypothetical protein
LAESNWLIESYSLPSPVIEPVLITFMVIWESLITSNEPVILELCSSPRPHSLRLKEVEPEIRLVSGIKSK